MITVPPFAAGLIAIQNPVSLAGYSVFDRGWEALSENGVAPLTAFPPTASPSIRSVTTPPGISPCRTSPGATYRAILERRARKETASTSSRAWPPPSPR
jgi:hypothetical protein